MSRSMGDPASELLGSGGGTRKELSEVEFLSHLEVSSSSKLNDRAKGQVSSSSYKFVKQRSGK